MSKIPPFVTNYRKTDTTAICLPVNLIFQAQKLARFLSWSSWSFKTESIQKVSYLKLNYSCRFQLILFLPPVMNNQICSLGLFHEITNRLSCMQHVHWGPVPDLLSYFKLFCSFQCPHINQ